MMPSAWAARNSRQVGPDRRGAGAMPAAFKILQTVEVAIGWPSRASSPWIRRCPRRGFSLASRSADTFTAARNGWASGASSRGVVPLPGDEPLMPDQQRARRDVEDLAPARTMDQPGWRGEPEWVCWLVADLASRLSAEHGVLVPQHEKLRVLLRLTAGQRRSGGQHLPRHLVQQRHDHLSMLSAARCEGCPAGEPAVQLGRFESLLIQGEDRSSSSHVCSVDACGCMSECGRSLAGAWSCPARTSRSTCGRARNWSPQSCPTRCRSWRTSWSSR